MKVCTSCEEELENDNFHKKSSSRDGLDTRCKNCKKEINSQRYSKEKETILNKNKEWRQSNPEYFNEYNRSDSGISRRKMYGESEKYRDAKKRYTQSDKGKMKQKEYNDASVSIRARKRKAKWRLAGIIKMELGCVDCGYNSHPQALQFDHINDDKKASVSNLIRSDYAWSTILEEISKCEVRCANCHSVVTATRRKLSYRESAPSKSHSESSEHGDPDEEVHSQISVLQSSHEQTPTPDEVHSSSFAWFLRRFVKNR